VNHDDLSIFLTLRHIQSLFINNNYMVAMTAQSTFYRTQQQPESQRISMFVGKRRNNDHSALIDYLAIQERYNLVAVLSSAVSKNCLRNN